jgi:LEA14-like dessication related protein
LGTLIVYNPNSVSLPVNKVTFNMELNGINVGSAETIDLKIEKASEFPIRISVKIDTAKIPIVWAEHIRRNEISEASIKINATFDLGVGEFTFPYTVKQPFETDLLSHLTNVGPVPVERKVKVPILGEKTVFSMTLEVLSGT